jgi:hypothetical protein
MGGEDDGSLVYLLMYFAPPCSGLCQSAQSTYEFWRFSYGCHTNFYMTRMARGVEGNIGKYGGGNTGRSGVTWDLTSVATCNEKHSCTLYISLEQILMKTGNWWELLIPMGGTLLCSVSSFAVEEHGVLGSNIFKLGAHLFCHYLSVFINCKDVNKCAFVVLSETVTLGSYLHSIDPLQTSRDSSVGIVTGYRLDDQGVRVRVPVGSRMFSSPSHPDRLWGPPSLLYKGTGGSFPWGKAAGAWSWPLASN